MLHNTYTYEQGTIYPDFEGRFNWIQINACVCLLCLQKHVFWNESYMLFGYLNMILVQLLLLKS